jgi:hypothetical protein
LRINSFELATIHCKQNAANVYNRSFAIDAEKLSCQSPTIQLHRAPRAALESNQHDIAHERPLGQQLMRL